MGTTALTPKQQQIAKRNGEAADRWAAWIQGRVRDHVLRVHMQRVVWDGMHEVIDQNPEIPRVSVLWEYQFDTYTVSQAAAIRRLAEAKKSSGSFARLLEQIGAGQHVVTRAW